MTTAETVDDGGLPSAHRAKLGQRIAAKLDRNPLFERIDNPHIDVFWRNDLASAQECADMRAMIDAGAVPSTLFKGGEGPEYRTSQSCHLDPNDPLVARISDRISNLLGIDPAFGETIQGQRYSHGQEYREHCDWFSPTAAYWPAMRAQGGQRCWTAMIYLSPVISGGETHFPCAGFMIPPREGMLLVWNNLDAQGAPTPYALHAALPVTQGTKYVLTKWYRERAWGAE
jgi:prolyl 4-hydroxylase